MPGKVVLLINSTGALGWSETYWTSSSSLDGLAGDAAAIIKVRTPMLGKDYYVTGSRRSVLGVGNGSVLIKSDGTNAGTVSTKDNDVGATGLQYTMGSGNRTVTRILRGIPDDWAEWSEPLRAMVGSASLRKYFDAFSVGLVNNRVGWLASQKKGAGGTSTQKIASLSISASGGLEVNVPSTAGYGVLNGSPVAIAGLKGLAGKLNGTYGPNSYSVTSGTKLTFGRQASIGQVFNYVADTGTVRLTQAPSNFLAVDKVETQNRCVTHKVGRPFSYAHGRRSGKR